MKKLQIALIIIIALLELLKNFINADLSNLIFSIGSLFLLISLRSISSGFRRPVALFLLIGISLLIYAQATVDIWVKAVISMLNIVGILVIMQLFCIPIAAGGYGHAVECIMRRFVNSPKKLFAIISLLTNIFGSFLLFGTIPVMLSLIREAVFKCVNQPEKFLSNAITRSYALVVLWTPTAVNIVIVCNITGASWQELVIPGFSISIMGLLISNVLEYKNIASYSKASILDCEPISIQEFKLALWKIYHIVLVVLGLVGLVACFGYWEIGSNTSQVMLAGLTVALIWIFAHRQNQMLASYGRRYLDVEVLKMLDLSIMFIAISVFSQGMEAAGILEMLVPFLAFIYAQVGNMIVVVLGILIIVLAYIGVHPFGAMVVIGNIVMSMQLNISPVVISLAILLGASVSYILSPFAGMVLTMSKFMDVPPMTVSIKWNGLYSLVYFSVASLFIYAYWYCFL